MAEGLNNQGTKPRKWASFSMVRDVARPLSSITKRMSFRETPIAEDQNDKTTTSKPFIPFHWVDIAPTSESQERARNYQLTQDSNQLTKEWTNTREDLESFVGSAVESLSDGLWKPDGRKPQREVSDTITTRHWADLKFHPNCQACKVQLSSRPIVVFGRSNRPDNCRKCGLVFCKNCLKFTTKLNSFAKYDPSGKNYMVCKNCFQPPIEAVVFGSLRNHTLAFHEQRRNFKMYGWDIEEAASEEYRFEPTPSSMLRQCKRLVEGYTQSLEDKSDLKVPALNIGKRSVPGWQKPPTWVESGKQGVVGCQLCSQSRFVLGSLHNCRVCGRRVCSKDSSSDFLLYLPDEGAAEYSQENNTPKWKIIRVVGCPETEPAVRLYLRICFTCKGKLELLQEKMFYQNQMATSMKYLQCMETYIEIHKETQKMKENIQKCLPDFVDLVDTLAADLTKNSDDAMKKLARHQDDLMDQFPRFLVIIDKLREITPQTDQQMKLIKSLTQEKLTFYQDNVGKFRVAGKLLLDIMSEDEIQEIQTKVYTDAINCTCLVITQLAYEVLKIAMKNKQIPEELAQTIKSVSEICEADVKMMITQQAANSEETWKNHKQKINEFIKNQMESDGKLLKLAQRKNGTELEILKSECTRSIRSTILHLQAKSSSRSFKKSKEALEKLLQDCA